MQSQILPAIAACALTIVSVTAQGVTKETVAGISTFARLDTTIACGGATSVEAVPELKKMGFRSIVNVRRDRKSTRLNSSHALLSRMPSSA